MSLRQFRYRCVWNKKHFWTRRYMFACLIEEGEKIHIIRSWDVVGIPRLPLVNFFMNRSLEAIEVSHLPADFHWYCKWLSIGEAEVVVVDTRDGWHRRYFSFISMGGTKFVMVHPVHDAWILLLSRYPHFP